MVPCGHGMTMGYKQKKAFGALSTMEIQSKNSNSIHQSSGWLKTSIHPSGFLTQLTQWRLSQPLVATLTKSYGKMTIFNGYINYFFFGPSFFWWIQPLKMVTSHLPSGKLRVCDIEHGHRNSEFSHEKCMMIFHSYENVCQRVHPASPCTGYPYNWAAWASDSNGVFDGN